MLRPEGSAEVGRWRTSRVPYLRAIMDAFSHPEVERGTVQKPSQIGYTEALNNVVGFVIDQDPGPILMVQPTVEMGKDWSKRRLAPMLRDTPCLQDKVKDPRSRDSGNTITEKEFPGGQVAMVGSNAPAGLAARPIRWLLFGPSFGEPSSPLNNCATPKPIATLTITNSVPTAAQLLNRRCRGRDAETIVSWLPSQSAVFCMFGSDADEAAT